MVRIGLIGMGRIGRLHGENIANAIAGATLVAAADPMLNDEMKSWAESKGAKYIYADAEELINNPEVDAVFICSSTATHADFIIKSAGAGKHIFCEKPIHTDPAKIIEALDAVEKAGVKLQVGFVRRFDHNHKKVHDVVASGKLGNPHIIKVTSRDPEPAPIEYLRTSGGLFVDMMIHDFDMVRYLSGSEVTEVFAYGNVLIEPAIKEFGDIDTAIVSLKFANGALGVIDNSRAARYGYDQRTEVHADKGCVKVENDRDDMSEILTAEGTESAKPTWFFLERYTQAFIAETIAFVNAIENGEDVPVNGHDGLMPVYIAIAADKSLREGRVVKLDEVIL
ncbi:MAG: inositol 2-dehydrogenase [Clostridiales Family XIII bacterium]|nr:inositol 2-dehydrogenase [Clostridiales Family XIII bacterium]